MCFYKENSKGVFFKKTGFIRCFFANYSQGYNQQIEKVVGVSVFHGRILWGLYSNHITKCYTLKRKCVYAKYIIAKGSI